MSVPSDRSFTNVGVSKRFVAETVTARTVDADSLVVNTLDTGDVVTESVTTSALTVPTGATDGYVLTSDASGNATWQEGGGGATPGILQLNAGDTANIPTTSTDIFVNGSGGDTTLNFTPVAPTDGVRYRIIKGSTSNDNVIISTDTGSVNFMYVRDNFGVTVQQGTASSVNPFGKLNLEIITNGGVYFLTGVTRVST